MPERNSFEPRRIDGLDAVFTELERHCHTTAIVTVTGPTGESFQFDMHRHEDHVTYGYEPGHPAFIHARTLRLIAGGGITAITIRSFLDETHPNSGLPYKELRAYHARLEDDEIDLAPLPADTVRDAYNTDPSTGEPLESEPEVIYHGPDTSIPADQP